MAGTAGREVHGRKQKSGKASAVFLILLSVLVLGCSSTSTPRPGNGEPLDYALWDFTLYRNTDHRGLVDYESIGEEDVFWQFIGQINSARPSQMKSEAEQLAFWINAYNALTVQLILDNQPVESITDIAGGLAGVAVPGIKSPWDVTVAIIEGEELTLQEIEDDKIRAFGDERIHFAINCASLGCPPLHREAFRPETLEEQLDNVKLAFIANERFNYLDDSTLHISKIFDWYEDEFKRAAGSVPQYLAPHLEKMFLKGYSTRNRVPVPPELLPSAEQLKVEHLPYSWDLNSIPQKEEGAATATPSDSH